MTDQKGQKHAVYYDRKARVRRCRCGGWEYPAEQCECKILYCDACMKEKQSFDAHRGIEGRKYARVTVTVE